MTTITSPADATPAPATTGSARKPKGLGRGLEALLGPALFETSADVPALPPALPTSLALSCIGPGPYQPRTRMDEGALYELAESIRAQGILQPILVRPLTTPSIALPLLRYEIIAGERRFRAAALAGLAEVPVLVRNVPDEAAAAMALIENIQREDLNPLEEAQGLQRLVSEFGLTHERAAQAVGRSRSAASNLLRLLQLAAPVQALLMAGDMDMGHARALLPLDKALQIAAANQIVARQLSVRDAESLAKKMAVDGLSAQQNPQQRRTPESLNPDNNTNKQAANTAALARIESAKAGDIRRVEEALADWLMATVEVRIDPKKAAKRKGKHHHHGSHPENASAASGEIAIRFESMDALNGLLERLLQAGDAAAAG